MNKIWSISIIMFGLFLSACGQSNNSNNLEEMSEVELSDQYEVATLGAGCFWCIEAIYQDMKGVARVESGYAGGHITNPTYKMICTGGTGHAEVAKIWFDPKVISYEMLLEVFWHTHDPTTLNRQGNDIGDQYRSVIFYHNDEQKKIAEESLAKTDASSLWSDPIVTEIVEINNYSVAEDYHQNYFAQNGSQPYCSAVIAPKVRKFRSQYSHLLKN